MEFKTVQPSKFSDNQEFIGIFGKIFEHSAWIAQRLWDQGISSSDDQIENLHRKLVAIIDQANAAEQNDLISQHPQLATPVPADPDSVASRSEQQRAGLAGLDQAGREEFKRLNEQYLTKFGFPFILAVEGLQATTILTIFQQRLTNDDVAAERDEALIQIKKIGLLRLRKL